MGPTIFNDEFVVFEDLTSVIDAGAGSRNIGRTVVDGSHGGFWMTTTGVDKELLAAHWQTQGFRRRKWFTKAPWRTYVSKMVMTAGFREKL